QRAQGGGGSRGRGNHRGGGQGSGAASFTTGAADPVLHDLRSRRRGSCVLLHATAMSSLPSNDRTAGARRWPAISGGIGVALVAVLIGWQMPSALHRSGHASNVASLKSEIA